jgi:formamidopyrimidine-DNA glycosylase
VPELPEIEVLRRDLERDIVGRKIKSVEVEGLKPIRRHRTKKAFTDALDGRKVTGVERRGRYLLMRLDGPDVLLVDLGPTGELVRAKTARTTVGKGTQVVITFTQGGQLRYSDPKAAGEMFVTPLIGIAEEVTDLASPGIDPLEASISWIDFGRIIASRHAKLKSLLMDPAVITGIGPVYSDEILFAAGLRWDRDSDSLTDQEVRRLYRAIVETVQEAVKYAGSRGDDNGIDHSASGEPHHFKVYEREGEACRRCRRPLVKLRVANRPMFFCEACQV